MFTRKTILVFILAILSFTASARCLEYPGYREFPSGSLSVSLTEDGVRQFLVLQWGEAIKEAGKSGPILIAMSDTKNGSEHSPKSTSDLNDIKAAELFSQATRLVPLYGLPSVATSHNGSKDHIQVTIEGDQAHLSLNYPKSEPARWNQALGLWLAMVRAAASELPLKLPEAVKEVSGKAPRPGVGPITDYTHIKLLLGHTMPSKTDYETISLNWQRGNDGVINMNSVFYPRMGDSPRAVPKPKIIPAMHKHLENLFRLHRIRGESGAKRPAGQALPDRVEICITVGEHPGVCRIVCGEKDGPAWQEALAIWQLARADFPAP